VSEAVRDLTGGGAHASIDAIGSQAAMANSLACLRRRARHVQVGLLTGRDAAHKKLSEMLANGESLPVDLTNRVIYYVGPVDPVGDEVVGPAGPTTATRMDKFTRTMLEQTGLIGMIGKAERGSVAIDAIRDAEACYMIAVGGAAYLVSKAIVGSKLLAFPELGMEAIYEFEVKDMPVTLAVDSTGASVHSEGPKIWSAKMAERIALEEV